MGTNLDHLRKREILEIKHAATPPVWQIGTARMPNALPFNNTHTLLKTSRFHLLQQYPDMRVHCCQVKLHDAAASSSCATSLWPAASECCEESRQWPMNQGGIVFSQLIGFLPDREFRCCVARYQGDPRFVVSPAGTSIWRWAFAQLTYCGSRKLYHGVDNVTCARRQKKCGNSGRGYKRRCVKLLPLQQPCPADNVCPERQLRFPAWPVTQPCNVGVSHG